MTASRGSEARTNSSRIAPAHAHDLRPGDAQIGSCSGVENYSRRARLRHPLRAAGLLPDDFLLIVDESHVTVPESARCPRRHVWPHPRRLQFRLPSAMDSRPSGWTNAQRIGRSRCHLSRPRLRGSSAQTAWSSRLFTQRFSSIRSSSSSPPRTDRRPPRTECACASNVMRSVVTTLLKGRELTAYLAERGVKVEYLLRRRHVAAPRRVLRELRLRCIVCSSASACCARAWTLSAPSSSSTQTRGFYAPPRSLIRPLTAPPETSARST